MIVDQLKRIDFFERGLNRDSTLLQSNRRLITKNWLSGTLDGNMSGNT